MKPSQRRRQDRRRTSVEVPDRLPMTEVTQAKQNDAPLSLASHAPGRWRLPFMLVALIGLILVAMLWGLPTYWTTQAEKALSAGRYGEADIYFQKVQRWQPRNATAALGQARAARCGGDPSRARALLSIAQSRGATSSQTDLERNLLMIQGGASTAMIDQLPAMLIATPEYGAEILEAFAVGFETLGSPELAVPYIDDWISAAPKDARALQHKAELLATLGQVEDAEQTFESALRLDASLIRSRRGLARLKLQSGKYDQALTMFDAAISADPSDVDSRLLRCSTLFDMRRDEEATEGLRAVLELDESNFAARHSLASKMAEQGQHQEVIDMVEPLMAEFPDDVSLNYLLASAFTELGAATKAEAYLKKHLEGRKQLDELARLKQSLKDRQSDGEGILKLAQGYLAYRWDEAEPWLVKAIAELPDSPAPYRAMASFQRKKGDTRRASEFAKAADAIGRRG